eukprot:scaffold42518_cov63-Phaeocystis_antarctica.AAC.3
MALSRRLVGSSPCDVPATTCLVPDCSLGLASGAAHDIESWLPAAPQAPSWQLLVTGAQKRNARVDKTRSLPSLNPRAAKQVLDAPRAAKAYRPS